MYELNVEIQANSRRFTFTTPSGTTMVKYQIKKIAEIQTFQRFLFCPFSSKIGKIMKSAEYNSGTAKIEAVLFTRTAVIY